MPSGALSPVRAAAVSLMPTSARHPAAGGCIVAEQQDEIGRERVHRGNDTLEACQTHIRLTHMEVGENGDAQFEIGRPLGKGGA